MLTYVHAIHTPIFGFTLTEFSDIPQEQTSEIPQEQTSETEIPLQIINDNNNNNSHPIQIDEIQPTYNDEEPPPPQSPPSSHPRTLKRGLSSISPEGTVNERTLLAWNRSFFGSLFIALTIIKLFQPSSLIFAVCLYFILAAFVLAVYQNCILYNMKLFDQEDMERYDTTRYPADRVGPYLVGTVMSVGYILVLIACLVHA